MSQHSDLENLRADVPQVMIFDGWDYVPFRVTSTTRAPADGASQAQQRARARPPH